MIVEEVGEEDAPIVAADLDQAVYEFGSYVEGKISKAVHEYLYELSRENGRRVRAWQKSGSHGNPPEPIRPDDTRLREIYRETIMYHVHGWVEITIDLVGVGTDLGGSAGKAIMRKRAKYDWTDYLTDTDDWETIEL